MMSPFPFLLFESDEKKNIATQKQDSKKDRIIHYILFSQHLCQVGVLSLGPLAVSLESGVSPGTPTPKSAMIPLRYSAPQSTNTISTD